MSNVNRQEKARVIIADDHPIFRAGLVTLLKQVPKVGDVYEAENGVEVLKLLDKDVFDILLLDIEMPVMNGIETLQELRKRNKRIKVLPLTMFANEKYLLKMYESGANGYLLKNTNLPELKRAIELLMEDENYYTPVMATKLFSVLSKMSTTQKDGETAELLTEREHEILQYICNQYSSTEVAEKLFISEQTVKRHRQSLIIKTQSKNTAGLVVFAIKNGLFSVEEQ